MTFEQPASAAAPIPASERIEVLDTIRGFALLGIFIMNMPAFNTSLFLGFDPASWPRWWDRGTETVRDILFSGKFNSMFSMLFAIGFTIQLERLRAREPQRAVRIYLRRLFWLFVFGIVHACVFWAGDVLHMYALLGLLLFAVQRLSDRAIVALMIACLLYPVIMGAWRMANPEPEKIQAVIAVSQHAITADNAAFGRGDFLDTVRRSTQAMILFYTYPLRLGIVAGYVQFFTTMLLGLLLGRHRVFQNIVAHLPVVRRVQWWALGIGIVCGSIFVIWRATVVNPLDSTGWRILATTGYGVGRIAVMIFYVATIVRAVCNESWRRRLVAITVVGRMPLSNYLLQTLMGAILFYNWGLGLWGKVGPALDMALAVALFFIVQVPLTRWWLGRFQHGPMEYLWRVLTYGRVL